jgi:hypothetical protein
MFYVFTGRQIHPDISLHGRNGPRSPEANLVGKSKSSGKKPMNNRLPSWDQATIRTLIFTCPSSSFYVMLEESSG